MSSDDGNLVIAEEPEDSNPDHAEASAASAAPDKDRASTSAQSAPVNGTSAEEEGKEAATSAAHDERTTSAEPGAANDHLRPDDQPGPSGSQPADKGKGKSKGKQNSQPSFDFDYDGPPVTVSNAMALELVNRFGLNNAWGAFLKLRGYRTPYDKSVPQPPEHVQALKRFRRKIRTVREMFNQFRDKEQDTDPFMTKEFVIQLRGPSEADGHSPKPAAKKKNGKGSEEDDGLASCAGVEKPYEGNAAAEPAVPNDPTQPRRQRKSKKEAKKEPQVPTNVPLTVGITPAQPVTCSGPSSDGALNKRIDEIVTNVIDRVMSTTSSTTTLNSTVNTTAVLTTATKPEPTLAATTTTQSAANVSIPLHHNQFAQLGITSVEQLQELYRQQSALFPNLQPQTAFPMQNLQSLLATSSRAPHTPAPLMSPSLALNQQARFFFQPPPAFAEPAAGQILLPPTPQPTPAVNGAPFPFAAPGLGTASLIRALQIQQPGMAAAGFGAVTLPANSLWNTSTATTLADLGVGKAHKAGGLEQPKCSPAKSDKKLETPKPVDQPSPRPSTSVPKSEPPKEEPPKIHVDTTPKPPKKSPKAQAPTVSPSAQSTASKVKEEKKGPPKKVSELEARVKELEETTKTLEEQLTAEKQKASAQKKRMDSMRDKLKKKDDELQTAKIDYACQQSDNVTLRTQMQKLSEENERLKKRLDEDWEQGASGSATAESPPGSPAPAPKRRRGRATARLDPSPVVTARASSQSAAQSPAKRPPRKRKAAQPPEAAEPETPESERRQSKRISAARSKLLCSTMT